MNQIICIGSSAKDIFFPTGEGIITDTPEDITSQRKIAFELGAKYQVDDVFSAPGGCATNVAQGLARLGVKTGIYTKIGDDDIGQWIKKELKRESVDTKLIETDERCKSDLSAIIVDTASKDHIIFFNRDSNEKLEIVPEKIDNTDWIFVSALNGDWKKQIDILLTRSEKEGIKIAFNPGQRNIKDDPQKVIDFLGRSQIVVLNKDEAIELVMYKDENIEKDKLNDELFLIEEIFKMGTEKVALTDGKNGAWAYNGKEVSFAEASAIDPVDTLGAGDAFTSGFISACILSKELDESLSWGASNGGNVAGFYGAKEGLLRIEKMEKRAKDIKISKIR